MTTSPSWLIYARTLIGIREVPGPKNNATIIGWAIALGSKILGINYNDDSKTPWCALFLSHVMAHECLSLPKIAIRASSWDRWGVPVERNYLGAVVRFQRPGGGHVALITGVSQDGKTLRILGGNQGDAVSETWIAADRAVARRWPAGVPLPTILAPVLKHDGTLSRNEK